MTVPRHEPAHVRAHDDHSEPAPPGPAQPAAPLAELPVAGLVGAPGTAAAPPATRPVTTALPSALRARVLASSGVDVGDVRVHRDSPLPAELNALAAAGGSNIHLGPGQDRHVLHEVWHIVQQRQGRVRATGSMAGLPTSVAPELEAEAERAAMLGGVLPASPRATVPRAPGAVTDAAHPVFQRLQGPELTDFLDKVGPRIVGRPDQKHLMTRARAIGELADSPQQALADIEQVIGRADDEATVAAHALRLEHRGSSLSSLLAGELATFDIDQPGLVKRFLGYFEQELGTYPIGMPERVRHVVSLIMDPETIADRIPNRLLAAFLRAPESRAAKDDIVLRLEQVVAAELGLARGAMLGGQERVGLPSLVHFVWSGREISPGALANILAWAKRADAARWSVILWTDKEISTWPSTVVAALHAAGVPLQDVGEAIDERLKDAYLIGRRYNLAGASDLVRLSILRKVGGIYSDVDIAPGGIDLKHVDEKFRISPLSLPLFGPGLRDAESVRMLLKRPAMSGVTESDVREAAEIQARLGRINNNFIVAHPRCLFLDPVINFVARKVDDLDEDGWAASSGFIAGITGPMAIKPTLERIVAIRDGLTLEQADAFLSRDVVCRWLLGWLTPDSEDQHWAPQKP